MGGGERHFVAFAALTIPKLSDNESLHSTEGSQGELKETNRLICLKTSSKANVNEIEFIDGLTHDLGK